MKKFVCFAFVCFLLVAVSGLKAQEEIELEPIIFTAERMPLPESMLTGNVSLITSDEIEESGAQSIGELLQDYAGITFQQSGALGKLSSVRVRGSGAAQLLFMLDGFRINDPSSGSFNLTNLSLDNIERIEVVRGGVSSLYGSQGMNGVINIITKKPSGGRKIRLKESYGTFSTSDSSLSVEGKSRLGNYRLFANNEASKGLRSNDNFRKRTLGAGLSFGSESSRFNLNLQGVEINNGLSVGWGGVLDHDDLQNDHNFFSSLSWERKSINNSILTFKVYGSTITNSYFAPGGFGDTYALTKSKAKGVDVQYNQRLGIVDVAYGTQYENMRGSTEFPDWMTGAATAISKGWHLKSYFINTITSLPHDYKLTIGARYDDYSNFGTELNPKFTISKQFRPGITTYFSTGRNFRAPTFVELHYPGYGNPALNPERSTYKEIGFRYDGGSWFRLNISGFNNKYFGLIQPVLVDPVTFRYAPMNIARARIRGMEIETVTFTGHNVEYALNYSHADSKDFSNGKEINRTPTDQYGMRVSWLGASRWNWTLRGRVVSSIYDTAVSRGVKGYSVFDGKLMYKAAPGLSYFIESNNLFDEDYEMVADFPAPGFSVRFGIDRLF
ncbi:MAG: TonB-dependent receptor [bacterium]